MRAIWNADAAMHSFVIGQKRFRAMATLHLISMDYPNLRAVIEDNLSFAQKY